MGKFGKIVMWGGNEVKFGKIVKWGGRKYGMKGGMEWERRETICMWGKVGIGKIISKKTWKKNGKIWKKLELWKILGKLKVWKM